MLGALGVYRAAFTTIEQTEANGASVREQIERVADNVSGGVIDNCGHFIPEERPEEIVRLVLDAVRSDHLISEGLAA